MAEDVALLLKESWELVVNDQEKVAELFYANLFLANPELRHLFPLQMTSQRERLVGALVRIIQSYDDLEGLNCYLRGLGRDHRKYNVEPHYYGMVKEALIAALRHVADERWSLCYEQAWNDVYDMVAARMIAGAYEDDYPPYWYAEVLTHERRGPNVGVFTCRPTQPMPYRAGQYVSIETPFHPREWRTYSIASAPTTDGTMSFQVRADGAGWVSGALVRRLQPGQMIKMAAPMGSMTLDNQSRRDIVCVAGGIALSPLRAIIEELAASNRARFVYLFRGVRTRQDFYDCEYMEELVGRCPWLTVVRAVSHDPEFPHAEHGHVYDVLARRGPWNEHDFYVSGSPTMVSNTLRTITEMRVPRSRIKYDAFAS